MTESNLFRYTVAALVATLVAPIGVALANMNAGGNNQTGQKISSYVGTQSQRDDTAKTDDHDDSATQKDAGKDQPAENTNKDNQSAGGNVSPIDAKAAGATYTVKAGDTYGCIAEKQYGSYEMWPAIHAANAGPGYGEYDLNVGAKLTMPAADTSLQKTQMCS